MNIRLNWTFPWGLLAAGLVIISAIRVSAQLDGKDSAGQKYDPTAEALADIAKMDVGKFDWPQWGGWSGKNNTPMGKDIPVTWDIKTGKNIKWSAPLGSQTYGNPVVANGKVYVGTNNNAGYLQRYPPSVDLGCLLCFDEQTGKFLWQHSSPKLVGGRVNDWPEQGICDAPYVDGERLWFVTSRGEVVCLDTEGFLDGENDGNFKTEPNENKNEADVIWSFDMMGQQGLFQHNMCSCSVTCWREKGILFVNTSNGVDAGHINLPAPNAPSFIAMNRDTGKVLWTDSSPGLNILHGQWSSPTFAVLGGQPQVLFAGGDGWLYSFDPEGDGNGKSKLLWKFDCNPKDSVWILGGRGTRNNLIATPVVYDGLVYIAVGQDPEHSTGMGHLWCIDPTKRGDVSPKLMVTRDTKKPISHRRLQAYFEWEQLLESDESLSAGLSDGVLSDGLRSVFTSKNIEVPEKVEIKNLEKDKAWTFSIQTEGKEDIFRIRLDQTSKILQVDRRTNELAIDNPNSAEVWHYGAMTVQEYDNQPFEEQMHRSCGTVAIKNDLLYVADFAGLVTCLDARTGKRNWTFDMFTASWGSPLIVEDRVYIGDEFGDVFVFPLTGDPNQAVKMVDGQQKPALATNFMDNAVYSTPIVANNVLFISNKNTLYAISPNGK